MPSHRAPNLLVRWWRGDQRRARLAAARARQRELAGEAEYQARLARWKGHRRFLNEAGEDMKLAGPMPQRSPRIPEPRTPEEN